jgi:hypothetical protein
MDRNRVRGNTDQPTPLSISVLPSLHLVGDNDPHTTTFSLGILAADAYRIRGGMISSTLGIAHEDLFGIHLNGIGGIVGGNLSGYQNSGVFNIVRGNSNAVQIAGVFNQVGGTAGLFQAAGVYNVARAGFNGLQVAGVMNLTDGPVNGVQISGVYNQAGQTRGAQIGLINIGGDVTGAQIGLVNIGRSVTGTQIGLVNISDEMYGIPIGLANVVERGIHDVSVWWEGEERTFFGFQNGSNIVYSLAYLGSTKGERWLDLEGLTLGAGAGVRIERRPFYIDADLSAKLVSEGDTIEERVISLFAPERGAVFPSLRASVGIAIGGGFGWFMGVGFDIESTVGYDNIGYFSETDTMIDLSEGGETFRLYPTFFTGLKF